jgi:hypothetical protein
MVLEEIAKGLYLNCKASAWGIRSKIAFIPIAIIGLEKMFYNYFELYYGIPRSKR